MITLTKRKETLVETEPTRRDISTGLLSFLVVTSLFKVIYWQKQSYKSFESRTHGIVFCLKIKRRKTNKKYLPDTGV